MIERLTANVAQQAIHYAFQLSKAHYSGQPLSVAVCDDAGFLMAFAKLDGAKLLTIELTQRKAYTSSRLGCTTAAFLQRLQTEDLAIGYFADEKFTALPGGIPLINEQKKCLGAVAIGGISAEGDHQAAEKVANYILTQCGE